MTYWIRFSGWRAFSAERSADRFRGSPGRLKHITTQFERLKKKNTHSSLPVDVLVEIQFVTQVCHSCFYFTYLKARIWKSNLNVPGDFVATVI